MKRFSSILFPALFTAAVLFAISARGQSTDNAGNYGTIASSTWTNGSNGGTGYGPWSFNNSGTVAQSGETLNDSTANGAGGHAGINSGNGAAWGLYGNNSQTASAVRPFSSVLQLGQSFSIDFENGFLQNGGTVGLGLQEANGNNRVEFFFVGGQSDYTLQTTSGADTGIGFTDTGLHLTFTLTSADTMNVSVTGLNGNASSYSTNNISLEGDAGASIAQVRLFNFNAGNGTSQNDFYNNMSLSAVPEPSTILMVGGGLAGMLILRRRKS